VKVRKNFPRFPAFRIPSTLARDGASSKKKQFESLNFFLIWQPFDFRLENLAKVAPSPFKTLWMNIKIEKFEIGYWSLLVLVTDQCTFYMIPVLLGKWMKSCI
jgi:hypothetical protein